MTTDDRYFLILIFILSVILGLCIFSLTTQSQPNIEYEDYIVTIEDYCVWDIVERDYDLNKVDLRETVYQIYIASDVSADGYIHHGDILKRPIKGLK